MPHIADGELTSIALCWQLARSDGAGLGLTSHDSPLTKDGIAYRPTSGIVPAVVTRSLGLAPDSGEIAGALSADALEQQDLALGRWDGAKITLFAMDWHAPAEAVIDLLAGELGEVTIDGERFSVELKGAASALGAPVCPSTSPQCRAQLGDKKCRVDMAGRSMAATVTASSGGLLSLAQEVGDKYLLGRLRYMSGANCGRSTVIIAVDGDTIRVRDLPRAPVEYGCRVELREGCDKRFATCIARFDNAANFRGEPHLPGNDLLTRYPGA